MASALHAVHSAPGRRIQHFIEHRWRSREKPQEAARSREKPPEAARSRYLASRYISRFLAASRGFSRSLGASCGFWRLLHRCSMKCGLDRCVAFLIPDRRWRCHSHVQSHNVRGIETQQSVESAGSLLSHAKYASPRPAQTVAPGLHPTHLSCCGTLQRWTSPV